MTTAAADPHQIHPASVDERPGGIAPRRIVVGYGFWLFLVSDIIMFSAFFAAYAVLGGAYDGGPGQQQLFEKRTVAIETLLLLTSTLTCGLAQVAFEQRSLRWTQIGMFVTGLLGGCFLVLEVREFLALIDRGAGPQRSAFLSSLFALVGCHGGHVAAAILWCGTMMAQIWARGFGEETGRRLLCFTLFWHALDIVWVGVFSVVYLIGIHG